MPPLARTLGGAALVLLGAVLAAPAPAQPVASTLDATLTDRGLVVSAELPTLANREVLEDGLRHVLEIAVEVRSTGVPSTLLPGWRRRCAVTYSTWTERFTLETASARLPREDFEDDVVPECCNLEEVAVGAPATYADHDAVDLTLSATLDASSPDAVHRLRRWVANPDATDEWVPSFLGFVVQVFLNRIVLVPREEVLLEMRAGRVR